jgi:hypothetical protein
MSTASRIGATATVLCQRWVAQTIARLADTAILRGDLQRAEALHTDWTLPVVSGQPGAFMPAMSAAYLRRFRGAISAASVSAVCLRM